VGQFHGGGTRQPLLNGSSGYAPLSLPIVRALAGRVPDGGAQRLLARMTDVQYVLVHTASMKPRQIRRWRDAQDVELLGLMTSCWD